jgi:hypothetical protein
MKRTLELTRETIGLSMIRKSRGYKSGKYDAGGLSSRSTVPR